MLGKSHRHSKYNPANKAHSAFVAGHTQGREGRMLDVADWAKTKKALKSGKDGICEAQWKEGYYLGFADYRRENAG